MVRIFLHSEGIRENTNQNNSKYGHFSRCDWRNMSINNEVGTPLETGRILNVLKHQEDVWTSSERLMYI